MSVANSSLNPDIKMPLVVSFSLASFSLVSFSLAEFWCQDSTKNSHYFSSNNKIIKAMTAASKFIVTAWNQREWYYGLVWKDLVNKKM